MPAVVEVLTLAPVLVASDPEAGPVVAQSSRELDVVVAAIGCGDRASLPGTLAMTASALRELVVLTMNERDVLRDAARVEGPLVRREEAPGMIEVTTIYDAYMGMERVRNLSGAAQAAAAVEDLAVLFADMATAVPVLDDVSALVEFTKRVLAPLPLNRCAVPSRRGEQRGTFVPAPQRWKLGHHVYGLSCRHAAAEIALARRCCDIGDYLAAAQAIERAVPMTRALTAAMVHAANISSAEYLATVRPTMAPPDLDVELTGGMNLDYRRYKGSLRDLVAWTEGRTFWDLHADGSTRGLALQLDRLLMADLLDWDRHIELTARLVGGAAALHERQDRSAVMSLRELQYESLLCYVHLLEHGRQISGYITRPNPSATGRPLVNGNGNIGSAP